MPEYRRNFVPGGAYFFTLVTEGRAKILVEPIARVILREALSDCKRRWPFEVDAIVLLPEHLHAIWFLPPGDDNYPRRWGFIKKEFSKRWVARGGHEQSVSGSRAARRSRGVWQPRYWEHTIRDDDDLGRHRDYIHYNPVKHERRGAYDPGWGCARADDRRFRFEDLATTAIE
jgi:putative transposase